jgi:hypothetical protein
MLYFIMLFNHQGSKHLAFKKQSLYLNIEVKYLWRQIQAFNCMRAQGARNFRVFLKVKQNIAPNPPQIHTQKPPNFVMLNLLY